MSQVFEYLKERYFHKKENGGYYEESFDDVYKRVALTISLAFHLTPEKILTSLHKLTNEELESVKKNLERFNINSYKTFDLRELIKEEYYGLFPITFFLRIVDKSLYEEKMEELYQAMKNGYIMPNTPTLMNAGAEIYNLKYHNIEATFSACFVIPMFDSITEPDNIIRYPFDLPEYMTNSITETVRQMSLASKGGGGTGFYLGYLRPKGSLIETNGGFSSGSISFLQLLNTNGEIILQGGRRRSANIGILPFLHQDILDFIAIKNETVARILQKGDKWNKYLTFYKMFREESENSLKDSYDLRLLGKIYKNLKKDERNSFRLNDNKLETILGNSYEIYENYKNLQSFNISILFSPDLLQFEEVPLLDSKKVDYLIGKWIGSMEDEFIQELIVEELEENGGLISLNNSKYITTEELLIVGLRNKAFLMIDKYKDKIVGSYTLPFDDYFQEQVLDELEEKQSVYLDSSKYLSMEELKILDHPNVKIVNVKDLIKLDLIGQYDSGDPALLNVTSINKYNNLIKILGVINATNPCGEEPLYPYDSCNLISVNIGKFVKFISEDQWYYDFGELKKYVELAVELGDGIITMNHYPSYPFLKMNKMLRRIGIGISGFAELLSLINVNYDSFDAVYIGEQIMKFISYVAYRKSIELAKKYGSFPLFNKEKYVISFLNRKPLKYYIEAVLNSKYNKVIKEKEFKVSEKIKEKFEVQVSFDEIEEEIKKYGIRNSTLLTAQPTGTVSLLQNTTSSFEPLFSRITIRYIKGIDGKDRLVGFISPSWIKRKIESEGIRGFLEFEYNKTKNEVFKLLVDLYDGKEVDKEKLLQYEIINDLIKLEKVRKEDVEKIVYEIIKKGKYLHFVDKTANEIDPIWHLLIQLAFQQWIDQSTSKTINMSHNSKVFSEEDKTKTTIEDIINIYIMTELKGTTIYRDRSKLKQVYIISDDEEDITDFIRKLSNQYCKTCQI